MKIVFMGTPDFAVGALEAIIEAGHEVTAVVTQPDKPKGRGKEVQLPPVKECALKYNIPVFQPVKIKTPEAIEILKGYEADVYVVAAFGQILSQQILDMPPFGCLCIHASLLPKYRGAAPIQWSIIDGEKETGVTIMQMDAGIDTGEMLSKKAVPITLEDTAETLHDKLMQAGASLIVETLPKVEKNQIIPEKQDDSKSCYAKMLTKSLGKIDWTKTKEEIGRLVRGLNPWPSAYTMYHGKTMKIWKTVLLEDETVVNSVQTKEMDVKPGMVIEVTKDTIYVICGNGCIGLKEVQLEGKKRMCVKDFLLGYPVKTGEVFMTN